MMSDKNISVLNKFIESHLMSNKFLGESWSSNYNFRLKFFFSFSDVEDDNELIAYYNWIL